MCHDQLPRPRFTGGSRLSEAQIQSVGRLVSLYVLPWRAAREQTRDVVADRHNLLPVAAEPVVLALRNEVAACADANAEVGWTARAGLDRTRIELVASQTAALIDRESLEEALSSGLCEPVDFDLPLDVPGFYEGVEVQPGHIAAGLPAPNPNVTGQVVSALRQGDAVLISGPSGVGKSTVMWAAAYSTRHILWYRVRRLRENDVGALVRLARASLPSERSPVGFVVDGVGLGAAEAWDALQRELAAIPGTALLGSARTEDLLPLRTLPNCTMIGVRLDQDVAAQIHAGLLSTGATTTQHWREAFDASHGLTLEYTHRLTRGRRLSDVLAEQVNRRIVEDRETELQIIARVATAHRWAADLPLRSVQAQIGVTDPEFRAALARLHEEHLVQVRGARLTGLHQLRSGALSNAVHVAPPPALLETVDAVVQLLEDGQLQPFIVGVLTDVPDLAAEVVALVATELARRPSPVAWIGVLQALRLVDFQHRATEWARILDRHDVEPAYRAITLQLAMLSGDALPELRPEIVAAVVEIALRADGDSPLRDELLTSMGSVRIEQLLSSCPGAPIAMRLLGVLAGSKLDLAAQIGRSSPGSPLAELLGQVPADELGDLLAAAHAVSEEVARALFRLAGGDEPVFARLRAYCPWLVEVAVVERDDAPVGYARLLHVSDRAQHDVEKATLAFARTLLRCLPMCAAVDVQTLLPGDVPIQVGDYDTGESRLQRRYDHPHTAVAWNRLRSQVATMAAGSMDPTTRAFTARTIVLDATRYLQSLTQAWCVSRGRQDEAGRLESQRSSLRARANTLMLPINRADLFSSRVDETAPGPGNDDLHTLVQGIVDNLTSRLNTRDANWASLAAFTGDTLRQSLAAARGNERWDLIGQPPPVELDQIERMLTDLHAVLAELAWGGLTPSTIVARARAGPYGGALKRVAELARTNATQRSAEQIRRLESAAQADGLHVQVYTRPLARPDSVDWPPVQAAIGVHLTTITGWDDVLTGLSRLLEHDPATEGRRAPVLIVPLIDGHPVRLLARNMQTSLWPGHDLYDTWSEVFARPHATPLTDAVLEAHQSLQGLSGLAVLASRREDISDHESYADEESARYRNALQMIIDMSGDDVVVAEIADYLTNLGGRVQNEFDQPPTDARDTLAASVATGFTLTASEDLTTLEGLLTVSLIWDLDPSAAARFLDER